MFLSKVFQPFQTTLRQIPILVYSRKNGFQGHLYCFESCQSDYRIFVSIDAVQPAIYVLPYRTCVVSPYMPHDCRIGSIAIQRVAQHLLHVVQKKVCLKCACLKYLRSFSSKFSCLTSFDVLSNKTSEPASKASNEVRIRIRSLYRAMQSNQP